MDNYYQHNLAIINTRWPALATRLHAVNPELDSVTTHALWQDGLLGSVIQGTQYYSELFPC